jgi:hypothetical protein
VWNIYGNNREYLKFKDNMMGILYIGSTLNAEHGFSFFNAKDICKKVREYNQSKFTQQNMIEKSIQQSNHFSHEASKSRGLKTSHDLQFV